MASIEHLAVGDKIFIPINFGRGGRIAKIERITATQALVGNEKFRRNDGKLVGSTGWETTFCRPATEEDFLNFRIQNAEYKLQKIKLSAETIEAAEALIKATAP